MKNFEEIKSKLKEIVISTVTENICYIVCDVYAQFSLYIVSEPDKEFDTTNIQMALSSLVKTVAIIERDGYIYQDLNHPDYLLPIRLSENVYYADRHIGLQNWDLVNRYESAIPIVCFYSFKGGLGRTTSLVLTAIQLARQGKKVALLDFDLEAPGLATLFSNDFEDIEQFKGVLDYLVDTMSLDFKEDLLDLSDYYYSISRQDIVGSQGGELLVFPAAIMTADENLYLSKFSKVNSAFTSNHKSAIDLLITQIQEKLAPDFILIDTRTGLNDLGGLFITRYATQSFLFFYGNRQNMFGLESILPKIRAHNLKFYLINSPVPPLPLAAEEREYFLQKSYSLFTDLYYEEESQPYINDETALHYPIEIPYNNLAVLLNSSEKLRAMLDENSGSNVYNTISKLIYTPIESVPSVITDPVLHEVGVDNLLTAFKAISPEGSSAAEYEFGDPEKLKFNFYPRRDYRFIFDRNKYLILGEKGAGKTALYAVLSNKEYALGLAEFCEISWSDMSSNSWIKGLDQKPEYPSESAFEALVGEEDRVLRNFWKCLLLRYVEEPVQHAIESSDWLNFIAEAKTEEPLKLDARIQSVCNNLASSNLYTTVIYDYLDVLIRDEKGSRGRILSSLIEVWRPIQLQQKHLSTKIFLRNDIFDREVNLTDKVKLNNHTSTISWEYDQLLNIVWKRLFHSQSPLPEWIKIAVASKSVESETLGKIPELQEADNRKLLENLLGQYMGGNNKAFPYNWILYHISDTKTQIQPRSLLNLFSEGARIQLDEGDTTARENPLKPKSMELAMDKVSSHRVQDIKEEYPLLREVFDNLKNYHQQFPIEESVLDSAIDNLKRDFQQLTLTIPEIKKQLETIGVLYEYKFTLKNKEKRYHIPDLYLIGMGLKRKGPGAHKALFGKKS